MSTRLAERSRRAADAGGERIASSRAAANAAIPASRPCAYHHCAPAYVASSNAPSAHAATSRYRSDFAARRPARVADHGTMNACYSLPGTRRNQYCGRLHPGFGFQESLRLIDREAAGSCPVFSRMRLSFLVIAGILLSPLADSQAEPVAVTARPRVGLVLAGGGAKGGAHVGVLKALEELHVPRSVWTTAPSCSASPSSTAWSSSFWPAHW